jgi:hypothetical protein
MRCLMSQYAYCSGWLYFMLLTIQSPVVIISTTYCNIKELPVFPHSVFACILCMFMLFVYFPGLTTHCGFILYSPVAGFNLLVFEVSWSHTTTHHSRWDSSGRVINSSQRPLPDNTQQSQQTTHPCPGGIWTHDLNRRTTQNLRLRPHGHWNRH